MGILEFEKLMAVFSRVTGAGGRSVGGEKEQWRHTSICKERSRGWQGRRRVQVPQVKRISVAHDG